MSLIAEFELDTPILASTRDTVQDLEYKIEDEFISTDGVPMLTAWAMGSETTFTQLDEAMASDSTVRSAQLLADLGDRRLYRIELASEGATAVTYPYAVEQGITFLEIRGSGAGAKYRAHVPDREALTAYRRVCERQDLDFKLLGLYHGESTARETTTLTARQREVLRTAYEAGYFSVPRQTTLDTLAADLGVSNQALSAILRRGEANLLADTIASDLTPGESSDRS